MRHLARCITSSHLGMWLPREWAPQYKAKKKKDTTALKSIVKTARRAGQFNTLITALERTGLADTLKGVGPFTVFAPTDQAFAKLPPGTLNALLADPAKLRSILLYHVVSGDVRASEVVRLTNAKTVNGASVRISYDQGVKVDQANVVSTDVLARNGVIHVIDTVLIPA